MALIRFGQDGWRARVDGAFNKDNVSRIASALGAAWAERHEGATVLLGYDTRRDSERFALVAGAVLAAQGLRAIVSDRVCTTPALGWSIAHDPSCVGGIMVTASEASREFGGLLVRREDGGPITPSFAERVERRIPRRPYTERGSIERRDLVSDYASSLVHECDVALVSGRRLRVVVDTMYGAATSCAVHVLRDVGCEVIALHDEPVPDFRGLHPDACEPWVDACERAVIEHRADLGIVLDGDCDRFALIDARGRLVSPHDLAPLVLEHIAVQRGYRGRVVATVASSTRVERQARRLGCSFTRVPMGFPSLYREFGEGDVILACDETGGICMPPHLPGPDGLQAALMMVELLAGSGEGVVELVDACERAIGNLEWGSKSVRLDPAALLRLKNLLPGLNPQEVAGQTPCAVGHGGGLRLELPDGSWMLVATPTKSGVARVYVEASTAAERDILLAEAVGLARDVASGDWG